LAESKDFLKQNISPVILPFFKEINIVQTYEKQKMLRQFVLRPRVNGLRIKS